MSEITWNTSYFLSLVGRDRENAEARVRRVYPLRALTVNPVGELAVYKSERLFTKIVVSIGSKGSHYER